MKAYVFSVNRDDITVDVGLLGNYTIKGCGSKFYGRTQIDDRKTPRDMGDRFETHVDQGRDIANDIVSRNSEDGLFVAEGSEPTTDELKAAIDAYKNVCVYAVRNADVLWEKTRNREVIPERARRAARYLGVTPEWLDQVVAETKECPKCAESIKIKATVCRFCGYDINAGEMKPVPIQASQQKR